jgi:hypothetical protein
MAPDGHPEASPFAMFSPTGNDPEVIVELMATVEKALAMADALELSLVGIDLCSALERIKDMHSAANQVER